MRVRHQGAILIGIPLVCQVVFAFILIRNIGLLEEAGQREANAKAVISACQDMKAVMSRLVLEFLAREFLSAAEGNSIKKSVNSVINDKFGTIRSLLKEDPEAEQIAKQYQEDLICLSSVVADTGEIKSSDPHFNGRRSLARYLNNGEQMEELLVYSQRCLVDDRALMKRFVPILEQWRPKALHERESLRTTILIAISVEIILSLSIAFVLGKRFITRLQLLMSNIDKFSHGATDLEKLSGDDELAELDQKFRVMAISRNEAEEFKRSLMTMVAHDLRSPLASSNLLIETILGKRAELTDWVNTRLSRLQGELHRLLRLANTLLDIERIESSKLELDCQAVSAFELVIATFSAVESAAQMAEIKLKSNVEFEDDISLDEDRIVQVLVNLVSNSIRFAPKNSEITLRIVGVNDDKSVQFQVIDHGPGVPEAERDKLFKKFSQTSQDPSVKKLGTGFGLYLTDMIVKAHGGDTGYTYSQEEGSCFFFEIPLTPRETPS
ncbi:MAG: HAMP domain-containing histidine kinase [Cyanobacteria bacterium]|nr:HAMP domain-containing histidine kinase [Cyanobacteriota bacterium]